MGATFERVVETRCLDQLQHRQSRRHRHRIAASVPPGRSAARRDLLHQVTPSAIGADGHAATDDLAERAQVRRHAVARLRATERDPEAGHHLVEDQQRAMPRAQRAQVLQEAFAWRQAIGVADHRFDDQAGDVVAAFVEQGRRRVEIVVRQGQRQVRERLRHAG